MKRTTFASLLSSFCLTALLSALAACGGGGGSDGGGNSTSPAVSSSSSSSNSSTASATVLRTGIFSDSPVQGLTYTTSSGVTGTTSAIGEYNYYEGDTVVFKLYGTTLNTQAASVILTPADADNVDVDYTVNLLRFLQTVDTDHDVSNGITMPTVDSSDAKVVINFNQDMYAFEQDATVLAFIAKYAAGHSLVDLETAVSNFNTTLSGFNSNVLDLTGATLTSKTYSNLCSNMASIYQSLSYVVNAGGTQYTVTGSDAVGYTTSIASSTMLGGVVCTNTTYTTNSTKTIAALTDTGNVFYGGPLFTYSQMNRIAIKAAQSMAGSPAYGLKSVEIVWHTPGTKTITAARHFIKTTGVTPNCPYYSVKEVLTITGGATLYTPTLPSAVSGSSSSSSSSSGGV